MENHFVKIHHRQGNSPVCLGLNATLNLLVCLGLMGVVDDESNITCFGLSDKRIPMTDEMCLASTTISPSVSPTVNEFAVF